MYHLLKAYYFCVCQDVLLTDDVNSFFERLDLDDFSYEYCIIFFSSLMTSLKNLSICIDEHMKENGIQFANLLFTKIEDEKEAIEIRNSLLNQIHLLDCYSLDSKSLVERKKSFSFYVDILEHHSIKIPNLDFSDEFIESDYFDKLKLEVASLVHNDYVIINQLLKEPKNRNYDLISLIEYKNSLSFFSKEFDGFSQDKDFEELRDYLEKRSFGESLLGRAKQKIMSIIKK